MECEFPDYQKLPIEVRAEMRQYIERHFPVSHFLTAVLSNDLFSAVSYATEIDARLIVYYVEWLIENAPHDCWGSQEAVARWCNHRQFFIQME